jgi:ketosteroid isomerase-like protein
MPSVDIPDLVHRYYSAWETKNRQILEGLLSDDFTFSSPRDDRISRAAFFDKCWPNSEKIRARTIEKLFEQDSEAFVRYRLQLRNGAQFRNTELLRFEGGKIAEVDVYFGRTIEQPIE